MDNLKLHILKVPDIDKQWYQCYLKDNFVAGGIIVNCDKIHGNHYEPIPNSTLFCYHKILPQSVIKLLLNYNISKKIRINQIENK